MVRLRWLACSSLVFAACSSAPATPPPSGVPQSLSAQPVVWTALVNATADGSSVVKSGGAPMAADAGAISMQQLQSGAGWFEFTAADTQPFRFVGLSHTHTDETGAGIDFAFRLQSGRADIYENGQWRADNSVVAGDVLRIALEDGHANYYKNGVSIYVSAGSLLFPIFGATSLIDSGANVTGAQIAGGVAPPPSPDLGPAPDLTPAPAVNRHRFCGWTLATGYAPEDSDPGFLAFAANADQFDAVHPIWWHQSADAVSFTRVYGEGSPTILNHTTYAGARTLLIPTISAVDNGEPALVDRMLNDANLRAQHIANLRALIQTHHYDGVDLDYEHLPDSDRAAFSTFAQQLSQALHADGKTLSFAVQAESYASTVWDYDSLAQSADQIHLMTYDYHYLGSHPGPIAPLGWVQSVLAYINTVGGGGQSGKFLLGLANYALAGSDGGSTGWTGTSMDAINAAGGSYNVTTDHMNSCAFVDPAHPVAPGRAPNAQTSHGDTYFEDLASMEEKVSAAQTAGLGGVTYFTIGGEPDRPGPQTFFGMVRGHFPQ